MDPLIKIVHLLNIDLNKSEIALQARHGMSSLNNKILNYTVHYPNFLCFPINAVYFL